MSLYSYTVRRDKIYTNTVRHNSSLCILFHLKKKQKKKCYLVSLRRDISTFPLLSSICIPRVCFPRTNGRERALARLTVEDLTHPDVPYYSYFATVIGGDDKGANRSDLFP